MAKRLRGTALAKRRYDVAQMNLAGMTLREIGEKLGVNAATVCRDLEWVREEWRKAAVEDFDQARAIELARLNLVERKYWEAWNRSTEDKVTRIEAYRHTRLAVWRDAPRRKSRRGAWCHIGSRRGSAGHLSVGENGNSVGQALVLGRSAQVHRQAIEAIGA